MARALWCATCNRLPQVLVVNAHTWNCAVCSTPVEWREIDAVPFTINHNDRKFLRSIKISVDDVESR